MSQCCLIVQKTWYHLVDQAIHTSVLSTFPLHVHSHHGLSKIIHTPKLYTHPRYSLLISYVFAQARPTMFCIH